MNTGEGVKIYTDTKAYTLSKNFLELNLADIEDLYQRVEKYKRGQK